MFRGSSFHNLDAKGRLIVPTRFRDAIRAGGGDGVMITRMDGCLFAYSYTEWSKIEDKIMALAEKSDAMRRFRRVFIGGAFECTVDNQGRVLVPPSLRQYSKIQKEIVVVGVLDHFEIWSKAKWEAENLDMEEDLKKEDVRNEIAKLGL